MNLNQQIVSELSKKLSLKPEVLTTVLTAESTDSDEVKGVITKVNGLQVFSEEQLQIRDANKFNDGKSEGVKEGVINTYDANDKRLAEKYGIAKKDGEKLPDFIERIISEKTTAGIKPSEELKRLQEQYSEKDTALKNALANADKIKADYEAKEKQLIVDSRIAELVSAIPIDVDDNLIHAQRDFLKYQIKNKFDVDSSNGQLIFKDKMTGKEIRNPVTADFKDPAEIVKEFAPSVVKIKEAKVPKNGAGILNTAISKEGLNGINFADYANANVLEDHLLKSGYASHDPKVQEIISKYMESDIGKSQREQSQPADLY